MHIGQRPMDDVSTTERLIRRLAGERGALRLVVYRGQRDYRLAVPDDSLWGAVKDNLLLSEYERCGIRLERSRGLVIDGGAHVGLFALRVASHAREVVALEPHPANYALLEFNVLQNSATNVRPMRRALWGSVGRLQVYDREQSGGASLFEGESGGHEVEAITLDELVARYGPADLLKLDIEGSEFEVLRGTSDDTLRSIRCVVAELHLSGNGQDPRAQAIVRRLRSLGFRVSVLEPPIVHPADSIVRLVRNWPRSEDLIRLKLVVLATYTLAALLNVMRLGNGGDRTADARLSFLYAVRERD